MRLRHPIDTRNKAVIRICIPARVSKDEKKRRSTAAQAKYVRKIASTWGLKKIEFTDIVDEGISGEVKDRPGIAQLKAGIVARLWDLIVPEDTSRLYRQPHFCHELVALAADNGVRVIGIGDDVDTAEEDWEERLNEAQQHHARDNKFTRRRLKRTIEDLWDLGAAVGPLRPGYLRKPTRPATADSEAEGPFYDHVDEQYREIVYQAFQRIANGESCTNVADYLTEMKLPKCNSSSKAWTVKNVRAMVRSLVYRGVEDYGVTVTRKRRSDGSSRQLRNAPENVRMREMPQLRIVPDWLWIEANAALDRRRKGEVPRGEESVLYAIPRDSRTPLAGDFLCGICEAKMYCIGSSYRCRNVHCRTQRENRSECWNHTTANSELTHTVISRAVVATILNSDAMWNSLLEFVERARQNGSEFVRRESEAQEKLNAVNRQITRLVKLAGASDDPPISIIDEIKSLELDRRLCEAELEKVLELKSRRVEVPDREQLRGVVKATADKLLTLDRNTRPALHRLLAGPILAVPYRLLDSDQFVLKAEFTLNLVNVLPNELLDLLDGESLPVPEPQTGYQVTLAVELFDRPEYVKCAHEAHELRRTLKVREIAKRLNKSMPTLKRAENLIKRMAELGLSDPYVRVVNQPDDTIVRRDVRTGVA